MPDNEDSTTATTGTDDEVREQAGDELDGGAGDGTDDESGDGELGDKGRKALEAERERARRARQQLAPWQQIAREFGLTPEQARDALRKAQGAGDEVEQARRSAALEATSKANARIVRAEVRAIAAESFADPGDAALYLNLESYEVDDEGEVDGDAIRADLAEVLKRKPHLGKSGAPKPDRSQGARGNGSTTNDPARAFGAALQSVLG